MRLENCIDDLYDTYNSIDVRCAAYFLDNVWNSAILVIRFRRETVDELRKIYGRLLNEIGIIQDTTFRTSYHALSIREWDDIYKNWNNGFISLTRGYSVNFPSNPALTNEMPEPFQNHYNYVDDEWNSYHTSSAVGKNNLQEILKNQNKNASRQGFEDIYRYLGAFFEMGDGIFSGNSNSLIIIHAPVFFKIDKVIFEDKKLDVICHGDATKKLGFSLEFYNFHPNGTPKKMLTRKFIHNTPLPIANNETAEFTMSQKLEENHIDHYFRLVIFKDSVIVAKSEGAVHFSIPTNTTTTKVTTFSNVLQQFLPLDELRTLIFDFKSQNSKDKGLNFERGITYLLNLLGINAALLGKGYDTIGVESDKISIDILANYGETIILGFVTMGVPSESEFARYRVYVNNLREFYHDQVLNVIPLLFSGASVPTLHDKAQQNGVKLIGKDELHTIFGLIENGNMDNARGFLISDSDIPIQSEFN